MKVHIFEEHSSVLPLWWQGRARPRTVIYLDAHLDLQHIGAERIARLQGCRTVEQVRALEKPHFLLSDDGSSYSLEDFLYPASRLGLVERLIWVAPPHVRAAYSGRAIGQLQQMDGVRPEDLYGFKRNNRGWIEGRILGLDMVVCDYRQLEHIALPKDSLIDIDIDYFITVPGDKAWVDPREVFEVLDRLPIAPEFVTLSRSVDSGFTPLHFRFIADYLAALWEGRRAEQAHYTRLFEHEARLRAGGRQAVSFDLRSELESFQDCAATWYLLGLAETDAAEAARCRVRAAELSGSHQQNALRSACELRNRSMPVDMSYVLGLERRLTAESGTDNTELGLAWVAVGFIHCHFRELSRAMDCYRRASALLGEHPEFAMEIGNLLAGAGRLDEAEIFLEVALRDDKPRTGAHFLLSQIHAAKGHLNEAREHLLSASEAAPAWHELAGKLAQLHARLGDDAEAKACRERCDAQRMQAERLFSQLDQGLSTHTI
jgi:tetratricopeptide (TPR) repeat protein